MISGLVKLIFKFIIFCGLFEVWITYFPKITPLSFLMKIIDMVTT